MSKGLIPFFLEERECIVLRGAYHAPFPTILLEFLLSERLTCECCRDSAREHYLLIQRPIEVSSFHGEPCPMMTEYNGSHFKSQEGMTCVRLCADCIVLEDNRPKVAGGGAGKAALEVAPSCRIQYRAFLRLQFGPREMCIPVAHRSDALESGT